MDRIEEGAAGRRLKSGDQTGWRTPYTGAFGTVFDQLDREWERLSRNRAAAEHLADVRAAAAGARSLIEMEEFVRRADPPDVDQVLLALVTRAVDQDDLAARVLLQLLLPGTRSLARRWWAVGEPDERAAVAVSAVYGRIRGYPLARRPGRVAANILMDAARDVRKAVPRTDVELTGDFTNLMPPWERPDAERPAHPAVELVEVLSDAVDDGLIGATDAALVARSRIAGERVEDLAASTDMRPRTVWNRRKRAELALVAACRRATGL